MDTSKIIKQAQHQPHPVRKVGKGEFRTQSRDGSHEHTVTRKDEAFSCNCSATGLCHHVTDVVMDQAREKGWKVVQVWTCEADARRQRRQQIQFRANSKPFWVTFAGKAEPKPEQPKPAPKIPQYALVSFLWDRWTLPTEEELVLVPTRDVQVDDGDGWRPARMPLADIFALEGWTRSKARLAKANAAAGGFHRYEIQMLRNG